MKEFGLWRAGFIWMTPSKSGCPASSPTGLRSHCRCCLVTPAGSSTMNSTRRSALPSCGPAPLPSTPGADRLRTRASPGIRPGGGLVLQQHWLHPGRLDARESDGRSAARPCQAADLQAATSASHVLHHLWQFPWQLRPRLLRAGFRVEHDCRVPRPIVLAAELRLGRRGARLERPRPGGLRRERDRTTEPTAHSSESTRRSCASPRPITDRAPPPAHRSRASAIIPCHGRVSKSRTVAACRVEIMSDVVCGLVTCGRGRRCSPRRQADAETASKLTQHARGTLSSVCVVGLAA